MRTFELARGSNRAREVRAAYLFVLPMFLLFLAFQFGPAFASLVLSLTKYEIGTVPQFIGLSNYGRMLHDPVFWTSVRVTATYTLIAVPLITLLALALAILVTTRLRGVSLYRALFFLPYVTSTVMAAIVWIWIYEPTRDGLLNALLGTIGIQPVAWLQQPSLVLPALALLSAWKGFGYSMMIFVAGLLAIPSMYREAAEVDGATAWKCFTSIILPLLRPVFFFVLVIETIVSFQVFDAVYVMTSGGPARASFTLVYMLYTQGFQYFNFGYACAIGVGLFIAVFVISLVQRRVLGDGGL